MANEDHIHWMLLRNNWALKYTPTKERIEMEFRSDQSRNPHNEPYHNKAPRRSEAEIVSDLCYAFADNALERQFGHAYKQWLVKNATEDRWTHTWRMNHG